MKQKLFFALAVATLAVACSKNAPVEGQDVTTLPEEEGLAPEAIRFSSNLSTFSAQTKAGGALEAWKSQDLYIYGIDRAVTDLTAENAIFINNVRATAPVADATTEPEGNIVPAAGPIELFDPAVVGGSEPFYYAGNTRYNFYGYYVDDAVVEDAVIDATTVTIPVKINGGQDIMIAKANPEVDILNAVAKPTDTTPIRPEYLYSAYSARRSVVPNLVFEHQLARFIFKIQGVEGSDPALINNVRIEGLTLTSLSEAELVVVSPDERGLIVTNPDQPVETFELRELAEDGTLQPLTVAAPSLSGETLGESIMVIPGADSYTMTLKLSQVGATTTIKDQVFDITPSKIDANPDEDGIQPADAIKAGYQYVITIMVYSLEEVKIDATLTPWEDGGSSVVDPDDPSNWD